MHPIISVIVPVYKAENYLHRCIDSILAQTYTDFELLLINDGSPDNSGAICNDYALKDSRVRVFHKENGGVSTARNLGLDNARGKYITFCDADDYVGEDWLMAYDETINDNLDFAIQGIFYITNKGELEIKKLVPNKGSNLNDKRNLIVQLMNQGVYGYPVTKLFRRQLIEDNHIRFDTNSAFREDAQFFSKFLEFGDTFICLDKEDYYYILPNSAKEYGGDFFYSLFPILQSLDVIFDRNLPISICNIYYSSIKTYAVQKILNREKLSSYHLDLYNRMSLILGHTKGLKKQLVNSMILRSYKFPALSRTFLKMVVWITKK